MPTSVTVGDRKIESITNEELVSFIIDSGYMGHPDYWKTPVIAERHHMRNGLFPNTLFFTMFQQQRDEVGVNFFNDKCSIELDPGYCLFNERHGSRFFQLKSINWFLKNGFYVRLEDK